MEIVKTYPRCLQRYIRFFYTIKASESPYIFNGGHSFAQRRLPDGTLDLIFNLGGIVALSRDGVHFDDMPLVALTGLYQDRSFISYNRHVHLVGAVIQPGSAHLFIREILTRFKASTIDAALVFGNNVYRLLEQFHKTACDRDQHHLLEHFLLACLQKDKEPDSFNRIASAVDQVHRSGGAVGVDFLHRHCLMSERNFRRRFNEYVGMSPKQYARIIRVKEFTKAYELSGGSYHDHLVRSGYTDHAHFNKDFQRIVGIGPTAYFRQLGEMDAGFIHLI